jgi:hypothetical protein
MSSLSRDVNKYFGIEIGAIVCCALVLAAALIYFSDSGCSCLSVETITFESPLMEARQVGDQTIWDVTVSILRVSEDEEIKPRWKGMTGLVKGTNGSIFATERPLLPYDPSFIVDESGDVKFWYIETTGNSRPDKGDVIMVTGLGKECEGADIVINKGDNGQVGNIRLPTYFP